MQKIKRIVDELILLGETINHEDVTDRVLEGLNSSYQSVIDSVQARDTPISFEELHEKLINKELLIQTQESQDNNLSFPATAHPTNTRYNKPSTRHYSNPKPADFLSLLLFV